MLRLTRARRAGAIVLAAAGITCGGGGGGGGASSSPGSPTAPGGTSPSGLSCRTYPTSANVHTTTSGTSVVFDALEAATFDPSTRKATVNTNFATGAPCSTLVTSYNAFRLGDCPSKLSRAARIVGQCVCSQVTSPRTGCMNCLPSGVRAYSTRGGTSA
jgi:hypothetical protein